MPHSLTREELDQRVLQLESHVNELKNARDALRRSESTYRTLTESLPGMVYRVFIKQDKNMEFFNNMLQPMTGYEADELRRGEVCSIEPYILPEDHPGVVEAVKRAIQDDKPFEIEYRFRRKNGSIRYFSERGRPIRGPEGEPAYIDGVIFDITARKQTEEELQQYRTRLEQLVEERTAAYKTANQQLEQEIVERTRAEKAWHGQADFCQLLIDSIPIPIFFKDTRGVYLGCNVAFEKFVGLAKSDIIGKSVYDIAPKELADVYHEKDLCLLENPDIQVYEFLVKDSTGAAHNVVFHKGVFPTPDGATGGVIGAILDITELKKAEEALRRSEEKLAGIVGSVTDCMVMVDDKYNIVWVNDRAEGFCGLDLVGKQCHEAYHGKSEPCEVCIVKECFADGATHEFETEIIAPDGRPRVFWATASVAARHEDGRPKLVVESLRDITQRKQAEEQRERLIAALQKAASEIKTLSGLLPICAWCKKIRDDKGYWNQIEHYIRERSTADFTHSICPECQEKYYPEVRGQKDE